MIETRAMGPVGKDEMDSAIDAITLNDITHSVRAQAAWLVISFTTEEMDEIACNLMACTIAQCAVAYLYHERAMRREPSGEGDMS